jgi:hypothetical protein
VKGKTGTAAHLKPDLIAGFAIAGYETASLHFLVIPASDALADGVS